MAISNAPDVVSFEAAEVTRAVRETAGDAVRSIVEYDREEFNPLYVDDVTLSFYPDEEAMYDHFAEIHSYVHIDFTEMELFTDELFPVADRVRYLTTAFDTFTLVRIYFADEGLFVALDPEEPIEPVVEAAESAHR
ncbi:MAG: hypothetical protein ABEH90_04335 [Halolamina sp.]